MDSNNWVTPTNVVRYLEKVLGVEFVLDLCASDKWVAQAAKYYTPEVDGLKQPWLVTGPEAEPASRLTGKKDNPAIWLNPPYGRGLVEQWTSRAAHHALNGLLVQPIIALLPNKTDTNWFHEGVIAPACVGAAQIIWVQGRISFLNPATMAVGASGAGKGGNVVVLYGMQSSIRTLRAKDMEQG